MITDVVRILNDKITILACNAVYTGGQIYNGASKESNKFIFNVKKFQEFGRISVPNFEVVKLLCFKYLDISIFRIQDPCLNKFIYQCIQRDKILLLITILCGLECLLLYCDKNYRRNFCAVTRSLMICFIFVTNYIFICLQKTQYGDSYADRILPFSGLFLVKEIGNPAAC